MEEFDKEVEWALMKGLDPDEHVKTLTHKPDVWETVSYVDEVDRQIQLLFAEAAERKAWEQLQQVEEIMRLAVDYWNGCQTRKFALIAAGKEAN